MRKAKFTVSLALAALFVCSLAWAQMSPQGTPGSATNTPQGGVQSQQPGMAPQAPLSAGQGAERLVGRSVQDPKGDNLGSIQDVVVDRNGDVVYLIIARGGILGFGRDLYPVPWQAFKENPQTNNLTLGIDPQKLEKAPTLQGKKEDLNNPAVSGQIDQYYGIQPGMR